MTRLFALLLLLVPLATPAADLAREARIAAQIKNDIVGGEAVWIEVDDRAYLAVYRRSAAARVRGAAMLLHDRGAHPEWPEVIRPLATGLPEHGWDTLAIQLPVAAADAPERDWVDLIPEAAPRIAAAVDWLHRHGRDNPVLIGHGLGARMAIAYLAANAAPTRIRALVAISLAVPPDRDASVLEELRKLQLPVLDVYGERDLPAVRDTTHERLLAARDAQNAVYTQVPIPAADPFFTGLDTALVGRIRAWLSRLEP